MSRSFAGFGCASCIVMLCTSSCSTAPQRSFKMGFAPIPVQPVTSEAWIDVFSLIEQNAEFVLHHSSLDWSMFSQGAVAPRSSEARNLKSADFVIGMSRQCGRSVLLVIDPLSPNREDIDPELPRNWGRNFADASVRGAFRNFAVRMAGDYRPEYLALGSEVNSYMARHPQDAANLASLIIETIPLVRAESPQTVITTTFQFEALNGLPDGVSQWQMLAALEPALDVVAVSTYPSSWFKSPAELPDDYYSRLQQHTSKPIVIAESGWPSGGAPQYHGSPANEEAFLNRVTELTGSVDLRLWVWWFLHDWNGQGYADMFGTMGLYTSDGTPKPAWSTWQQIQGLPLADELAIPLEFPQDGMDEPTAARDDPSNSKS